jgi:hypothetical protein
LPALHPRPSRSRTRSRATTASALVALALAAGGCSSSGSSSPGAAPTTQGSAVGGAQPMASSVTLGKVAGNLRQPNRKVFKKHRKQTLKQVGRAVDTWIDGGFVGVDYPRAGFGSAFQAFTKPARHDARKQQRLMTNWDLRKRIDGVDVKKRKVTVDVLAPHGRPAGATARIALVFTTTGHTTKRVAVHGRLFLGPDDHGTWRIFGYDVAKGGK